MRPATRNPASLRHGQLAQVGSSGARVSRLGLGTAPLGGLFNSVAEREAGAVVRTALERGVRYLDTAPLYGLGLSEQRAGRALAGVPRASFTVSTKVGRLVRPPGAANAEQHEPHMWPEAPPAVTILDYSAAGIRRSIEESLERLGLDSLDIAYVHDPDEHMDEALRDGVPELERLRDEGVITAFGFGMNHTAPLVRAVRESSVDCVLVAGRYTLLDQSAGLELLPLCAERGVSVVVGGVFNSGILAAPEQDATFDYAPAAPAMLARARRLMEVCAAHDVALPAAAVQFPLGHRAVHSVLVGIRSTVELEQAVTSFDRELPDDLWREIVDEGLLPEGVTVQ
jgi:D-threo-aldose 1-dehydrogenase